MSLFTNSVLLQIVYLTTRPIRLPTFIRGFCFARVICFGIVMAVVAPVHAEVKVTPYSEFVKALNIIEQTQLTLFTDTIPTKQEVIDSYNARAEVAQTKLDQADPNFKQNAEKKRIEIMRELLSTTLEQFNDQYANYIDPENLKKYNSRRSGNFVGVGLKFRARTDDHPLAIGPLSGGPMANANIKPGDKLLSVDEKPLFNLSSSEVVTALKGPQNSIAKILVSRDDKQHTVSVKRSAVELHYADAELLDQGIGLIKISRFGSKTHTRVAKLLNDLIKQGATGFILDLRDNPGGSTRAARAIVSMFTTEQDVYCERYKTGAVKSLPRHGNKITDLPLAVLINGASMSSSEIVAGAIQSYQRGIIIGSPSFGKGLVQKVFNLKPPLGGAVRTTIAVFGRPDHQLIHNAGIVPDKYVATDSDFMFKRTGSLNISADARAFQRILLEQSVADKYPEKAKQHIEAKDLQLQAAINKLQVVVSNSE